MASALSLASDHPVLARANVGFDHLFAVGGAGHRRNRRRVFINCGKWRSYGKGEIGAGITRRTAGGLCADRWIIDLAGDPASGLGIGRGQAIHQTGRKPVFTRLDCTVLGHDRIDPNQIAALSAAGFSSDYSAAYWRRYSPVKPIRRAR